MIPKLKILLAAAAVACIGASASADLIQIGDYEYGDSWSVRGRYSNVPGGWFDTLVVRMVTPGFKFEPPAFRNFSDPDWSVTASFNTFCVAQGDDVTSVDFDLWFADDDPSDQRVMDWAAFHDGVLVEYGQLELNSWIWRGEGDSPLEGEFWVPTWDEVVPLMVPIPAPVALAGVGLEGVVFGRRRLRKIVGI